MAFTNEYKKNAISTDGIIPILLVEIAHSSLTVPWRFTNHDTTVTHLGNDYYPRHSEVNLPSDGDAKAPSTTIVIGNIDQEVSDWIFAQNGARGSICTITQVLPYDTNVKQLEFTLEVLNTSITDEVIVLNVGFIRLTDKPTVRKLYDQYNAPGL